MVMILLDYIVSNPLPESLNIVLKKELLIITIPQGTNIKQDHFCTYSFDWTQKKGSWEYYWCNLLLEKRKERW